MVSRHHQRRFASFDRMHRAVSPHRDRFIHRVPPLVRRPEAKQGAQRGHEPAPGGAAARATAWRPYGQVALTTRTHRQRRGRRPCGGELHQIARHAAGKDVRRGVDVIAPPAPISHRRSYVARDGSRRPARVFKSQPFCLIRWIRLHAETSPPTSSRSGILGGNLPEYPTVRSRVRRTGPSSTPSLVTNKCMAFMPTSA